MNVKVFLFLIVFSIAPILLIGQNVKLGYNFDFINPGFTAGYEHLYKIKNNERKLKSGKIRSSKWESIISGNIGFYHHTGFHDNIYVTFGWAKRRVSAKGFYFDFSPEIGLSRTFVAGTTYNIENPDNIEIKSSSGYFYPLLGLGFGIGHDFSARNKNIPIMASLNIKGIAMYPYNSFFYLRPIVELGLIYRIKQVK
ncbi:MAG: hypothetical protein KA807_16520 [Prolixibacteraceae bacterium]|nr:hypothetical protein [Prolixibacteraceae bacterium]